MRYTYTDAFAIAEGVSRDNIALCHAFCLAIWDCLVSAVYSEPYGLLARVAYMLCVLYLHLNFSVSRFRFAAQYCFVYFALALLWCFGYWMLFVPTKPQDIVFMFIDNLLMGSIFGMYALRVVVVITGLYNWMVGFPMQILLARRIVNLASRVIIFLVCCTSMYKAVNLVNPGFAAFGFYIYITLIYLWIGLFIRRNKSEIETEIGYYSRDPTLEKNWLNFSYFVLGFFCLLSVVDTGREDRFISILFTIAFVLAVWVINGYVTDAIVKFWGTLSALKYNNNYNIALTIARFFILWLFVLFCQMLWNVSLIPQGYDLFYAFMFNIICVLIATEVLIVGSGLVMQRVGVQEYEFSAEKRKQRISTLFSIYRVVFSILRILACVVIFLGALGLELNNIISNLGFMLAALSFVLKDEGVNILSGFAFVLEGAISVGDLIEIDNTMGEVEAVGVRSVRLRSIDGTLHYIPFSAIRILRNKSKEFSYVMLNISVVPGTDIEKLTDCVKNAMIATVPQVEAESVMFGKIEYRGVIEITAERLVYQVRIKCSPGKQFIVKRILNIEIYREFKANGIVIPKSRNVILQIPSVSNSDYVLK